MIDHVVLKATTASFKATVEFYEQALQSIGYKNLRAIPDRATGFGDTSPDFWIFAGGDGEGAHVALRAKDREAVRQFYDAAIKAGGKDNGKPGIREHINSNYYAAFVHDPAGNNVEVVCHEVE